MADVNDEITTGLEQLCIEKQDNGSSRAEETGLIFHECMIKHHCVWDENYPENPNRFKVVLKRFEELGLRQRCKEIEPREATEDDILLIHEKDYLNKIKSSTKIADNEELEEFSSQFDFVYFNSFTYQSAMYAAGSCIEIAKLICENKLKNGFALVRPPGHHAMEKEANGYCIFNNVAITAKYVRKHLNIDRVLIIDWDVHHGQASQYAFYDDPSVLYFSTHRYDFGQFWPELIESNYNFVGTNNGKGYNVNVPLNENGMHDSDFLAIWFNILLPIAYEFNPQFVIISAGYDAALGCPEGEMCLSPLIYAHLTHSLMSLANGKLLAVLEGGYCLKSLAESAAFTLRTLLGDPCPMPLTMPFPLHQAIVSTILDTLWAQRKFWKFLCIQGTFNKNFELDISKYENIRRTHTPKIDYRGKLIIEEKPLKYPTRDNYPTQNTEVKEALNVLLDEMISKVNLKVLTKQTTVVFNEFMCKHSCADQTHPERPSRIRRIYQCLELSGLLKKCNLIKSERLATDDELRLAHADDYLNKLSSLKAMSEDELNLFTPHYRDFYANNDSYEVAKLAVGCLLDLVDDILTSNSLNGYAIIRPPGHHANKSNASGFCLLNNVAIAAKYALEKHKLNRVLIIDWDVHHGDGTQDLVKDDERILYISLHRYDYAGFYPLRLDSGIKTNKKNIINIAWNNGSMSDCDYLLAFFNIVLPIAYEFNPEFILVSNGLDAAAGDPLGGYDLSPEIYSHFISLLSGLANGRLAVALEGGYNLESLAKSSNCIVSALLGNPPATLIPSHLNSSSSEVIRDVIDYHASNWLSLAFNADLPDSEVTF